MANRSRAVKVYIYVGTPPATKDWELGSIYYIPVSFDCFFVLFSFFGPSHGESSVRRKISCGSIEFDPFLSVVNFGGVERETTKWLGRPWVEDGELERELNPEMLTSLRHHPPQQLKRRPDCLAGCDTWHRTSLVRLCA